MKNQILFGAAIGLLFISCAASLTRGGSHVQIVTDRQKECCCEFIDVIAISDLNVPFSDEKMQNVLIHARNRVARLGGNAMRILSVDTNRKEVTVVVEALRCDFDEMNKDKNSRGELR